MTYDSAYLDKHAVLKVITGSTAQGTAIEGKSDKDIKVCVNLPLEEYLTLGQPWETSSFSDPDIEYHSVGKLINMLRKQNPTALEIISVDEEFVLYQGYEGRMLRDNLNLFLSKKAYKTFYGYAHDQLMRIKNALNKSTEEDLCVHIKHTINRMVENFEQKYEKVDPLTYNFRVSHVGVSEETGTPEIRVSGSFEDIDLQTYFGMVSELNATYKNYKKMGSRNIKATEEKLWKHASHLVRLILTCDSLMKTGVMRVRLDEHIPLLMQIKTGGMSWEDLFSLVTQLTFELEQSYLKSVLPEDVDYESIQKLYKSLMIRGVSGEN